MDWLRRQLREGRNARTYVLVGVLLAVLLWVQSLESKQRVRRAGERVASAAPAAASAVAAPPSRAAHAAVEAGWGPDPFARRFSAVEEATARAVPRGTADTDVRRAPALHLQGVMSGPLGRTALINGSVYREGDRIGIREVLQIGARSVTLRDRGTVTTLHLRGDER